MAKEKQETESEIINETDTTTELTVEKQGKELIDQTNLSSSNLIKEFEREQLKKQLPEIYVGDTVKVGVKICLLYTSPSPRDVSSSRMPSSA